VRGDVRAQAIGRSSAKHPVKRRRPAEQRAGDPERLARPRPQRELVAVGEDAAVAEGEGGVHAVVDRSAGPEGVVCLPMRGAEAVIRAHLAVLHAEILALRAQHAPHGRDVAALELKDGVLEGGVGGVAGRHHLGVALGEGGVEAVNQLGVGVHEAETGARGTSAR